MAKKAADGPSKMSMVRDALGELGAEAKPKAIAEHVRKKHGARLSPSMISAYKSVINGGGAGKSRVGRGGGGAAISLSDVEAVRGLVDRIGAGGLNRLVKMMS